MGNCFAFLRSGCFPFPLRDVSHVKSSYPCESTYLLLKHVMLSGGIFTAKRETITVKNNQKATHNKTIVTKRFSLYFPKAILESRHMYDKSSAISFVALRKKMKHNKEGSTLNLIGHFSQFYEVKWATCVCV